MFDFVKKFISSTKQEIKEEHQEYPEYSFRKKSETTHCSKCNRDVRDDETIKYYDVWTYFLCPHCGNTLGWRTSVL